MTKNIGESVRARLKNIAVREGSDFNAVLIRYSLERNQHTLISFCRKVL